MLDSEQIKQIIPHREPFLFVDRVVSLEPGKGAVGYKKLTGDEYFFAGHFPGMPVMPGVLILEALAQTGAVAILSMDQFRGKVGYFAEINKARFKRKVFPGDELRLEVRIDKIRGGIGMGSAVAYVGEEKAAYCEIVFAVA